MLYAQYCRIEWNAGGVGCSVRGFLRECRKLLSDKGKSFAMREQRHAWLRAGLQHRAEARQLYRDVVGGRIR